MNPLTPDHHFYIDQGTNARLRIVLVAIGVKLAEAGALDDPEDVMYLRYNELRLLMADPCAVDARELVSDRRDYHEDAAERRPPSWVGTATQTALDFPYNALWGFPEKFHAGEPATTGEVRGLAASPGVVEGLARYVHSLEEFDQVRQRRDPRLPHDQPGLGRAVHEDHRAWSPRPAARCRTRPSSRASSASRPWSARPNAGERIKTGDRIRVNGTTGVVELLGRDRAGLDGPGLARRRRWRCAPSTATRRRCSRAGRSWGS